MHRRPAVYGVPCGRVVVVDYQRTTRCAGDHPGYQTDLRLFTEFLTGQRSFRTARYALKLFFSEPWAASAVCGGHRWQAY